ncbi:hypothetical protein, partial [Methylomonas koyamae]|uniref:hypothetical protein n=2 Tax=Methylomonas TaxID=416 RepID=UPI000B2CAF46
MPYKPLYSAGRIHGKRFLSAIFVSVCIEYAEAALLEIPGGDVPAGTTFVVNSGDTLLTGDLASGNADIISIDGTLVNKGYTIFNLIRKLL